MLKYTKIVNNDRYSEEEKVRALMEMPLLDKNSNRVDFLISTMGGGDSRLKLNAPCRVAVKTSPLVNDDTVSIKYYCDIVRLLKIELLDTFYAFDGVIKNSRWIENCVELFSELNIPGLDEFETIVDALEEFKGSDKDLLELIEDLAPIIRVIENNIDNYLVMPRNKEYSVEEFNNLLLDKKFMSIVELLARDIKYTLNSEDEVNVGYSSMFSDIEFILDFRNYVTDDTQPSLVDVEYLMESCDSMLSPVLPLADRLEAIKEVLLVMSNKSVKDADAIARIAFINSKLVSRL